MSDTTLVKPPSDERAAWVYEQWAAGRNPTGRDLSEHLGGEPGVRRCEQIIAKLRADANGHAPRPARRPPAKRTAPAKAAASEAKPQAPQPAPANETTQPEPAPAWTRTVSVGAVITVAVFAAIISGVHVVDLAQTNGQAWLGYGYPVVIDGAAVAASVAMWVHRRSGRTARLATAVFAAAAAASVAANILSADPTWTARAIAAAPPLALLGTYHVALQAIRPRQEAHHG